MDPAGGHPPAPANTLFSADGPDLCPRCLNGFKNTPLCTDPPCEKWPEPAYDVVASPENQEMADEDPFVPLPAEYDERIEELVPRGPEDDLIVEDPPAPGNTPTSEVTEGDKEAFAGGFTEEDREMFDGVALAKGVESVASTHGGEQEAGETAESGSSSTTGAN